MSIYEYDEERHMRQTREEGRREEREKGIKALIEVCREFGASKEETIRKLTKKYPVQEIQAEEYVTKYWN